jgi:hypothetical protein
MENIEDLIRAIESLIDAKADVANGGYNPIYQARADMREALTLLLENVEKK